MKTDPSSVRASVCSVEFNEWLKSGRTAVSQVFWLFLGITRLKAACFHLSVNVQPTDQKLQSKWDFFPCFFKIKKSLFPHTVKTVRPAGLTSEAQRLHQRHEDVLSHFSIYFVVFYCIFWVVCTCRLMWNATKAECRCSFTLCQSGWKREQKMNSSTFGQIWGQETLA